MRAIITCNAGSSNTKLGLFYADSLELKETTHTHSEAETISWLKSISPSTEIAAIGHRVVHGGGKFTKPAAITPQILQELAEFIPLAPLHQPAALKFIEETCKLYPNTSQFACFDTSFHHTTSNLEKLFPLPKEYSDSGIMRYGFHGLSYEYIASVLPEHLGKLAEGRVVVAHLGNGSSMCAVKNCKSVASTMGFSTLDGLMMGSRCGALDSGVILHLLEHKNMSVTEITDLLYKRSGLLGVSGLSMDMRELLASGKKEASDAVELYCYLAAKQLCSLLPALGGIDALVFTAGIGEHAAPVREKISNHLNWLGKFPVYVIATNEELVIARACKENI